MGHARRLSDEQKPHVYIEGYDKMLVQRARAGDNNAMDRLIDRYRGFVRMKASAYFLAGGESGGPHPGGPDRPLQGGPRLPRRPRGLVPLVRRALRHAPDHHRDQDGGPQQALAAEHLRLVQPHARRRSGDQETSLADVLPGDPVADPITQAISSEELRSLVGCLGEVLSPLEGRVLAMYMEGRSYEEVAGVLGCTPKTVDNALQRVKRKVGAHLRSREVLDLR